MSLELFLPAVNAALNATSALLACLGFWNIRQGKRVRHQRFMLAAFLTSALFLVNYLARTALFGTHRYPELGLVKILYLVILGSHMLLAIAVVPLLIIALFLAFKERFPTHRRVVRFAWPIWIYVSVTGVIVYAMLYQLAPFLSR